MSALLTVTGLPLTRDLARLLLIQQAAGYLEWAVEQPGGSNTGQVVNAMLKGTGLGPGYPWCAAGVHHWGYYALYDPLTKKSAWPLPATAGCAVLGDFGAKHKILYEKPQVGDVALIWHIITHKDGTVERRFGHTCVVIWVSEDGTRYKTIEGNTSKTASREGIGVYALERTVHEKDRFCRWYELLPV